VFFAVIRKKDKPFADNSVLVVMFLVCEMNNECCFFFKTKGTTQQGINKEWQGSARQGKAWRGSARLGSARRGMAWYYAFDFRKGKRKQNKARPGEARPGEARRGTAWRGLAWRGLAWQGEARHGKARRGMVFFF
jgi:hypothetical protein